MVIVPNIAPDTPPLQKNPVFFYPNSSNPDIAVNIDDVLQQKIYAVSAHESQFFEWLPWTQGTLDKVPAGKEERLSWVGRRFGPANDSVKECLKKWYGEQTASGIIHAEAFKNCEFGTHPNNEEILKLFPMLNKKK
jgi:hypothetical protein